MKLSDRVDALEGAIVKHLEESGEIRTDLKWIKKSVVGLYASGGIALLTAVAEHLWR